jgi:hypothetical protein
MPTPAKNVVAIDGRLTSAVTTGIQVQMAGIMAALGGASVAPFWEVGVASYLRLHFEPLVAATMNADIDVQRRRKS